MSEQGEGLGGNVFQKGWEALKGERFVPHAVTKDSEFAEKDVWWNVDHYELTAAQKKIDSDKAEGKLPQRSEKPEDWWNEIQLIRWQNGEYVPTQEDLVRQFDKEPDELSRGDKRRVINWLKDGYILPEREEEPAEDYRGVIETFVEIKIPSDLIGIMHANTDKLQEDFREGDFRGVAQSLRIAKSLNDLYQETEDKSQTASSGEQALLNEQRKRLSEYRHMQTGLEKLAKRIFESDSGSKRRERLINRFEGLKEKEAKGYEEIAVIAVNPQKLHAENWLNLHLSSLEGVNLNELGEDHPFELYSLHYQNGKSEMQMVFYDAAEKKVKRVGFDENGLSNEPIEEYSNIDNPITAEYYVKEIAQDMYSDASRIERNVKTPDGDESWQRYDCIVFERVQERTKPGVVKKEYLFYRNSNGEVYVDEIDPRIDPTVENNVKSSRYIGESEDFQDGKKTVSDFVEEKLESKVFTVDREMVPPDGTTSESEDADEEESVEARLRESVDNRFIVEAMAELKNPEQLKDDNLIDTISSAKEEYDDLYDDSDDPSNDPEVKKAAYRYFILMGAFNRLQFRLLEPENISDFPELQDLNRNLIRAEDDVFQGKGEFLENIYYVEELFEEKQNMLVNIF